MEDFNTGIKWHIVALRCCGGEFRQKEWVKEVLTLLEFISVSSFSMKMLYYDNVFNNLLVSSQTLNSSLHSSDPCVLPMD